jgi:hypothetical protein
MGIQYFLLSVMVLMSRNFRLPGRVEHNVLELHTKLHLQTQEDKLLVRLRRKLCVDIQMDLTGVARQIVNFNED